MRLRLPSSSSSSSSWSRLAPFGRRPSAAAAGQEARQAAAHRAVWPRFLFAVSAVKFIEHQLTGSSTRRFQTGCAAAAVPNPPPRLVIPRSRALFYPRVLS